MSTQHEKQSRILGDYTPIKQIGQGSLGGVFLAEHRFIKKQYVLKVFPRELAEDRGFLQRFEQEVAVLAGLEHPGIVKVHNISFAQGVYFLVTDCVVDHLGETTNLTQFLIGHQEALPEKTIYSILSQIAEALDYAHSYRGAGLVHRGIKPNNILVGKGRGEIKVYLSDYGLSKIVGVGAVLTRTFRAMAEALGIAWSEGGIEKETYPCPPIDRAKLPVLHQSFLQNFAFLAPEQKDISLVDEVSTKADTYAFGILAYHLLTKSFPEGFFPMPSVMSPQYSRKWDGLIWQCLQQDPNKRPDSLVETLQEVFKEERKQQEAFIPTPAATPSPQPSIVAEPPKAPKTTFTPATPQNLFSANEGESSPPTSPPQNRPAPLSPPPARWAPESVATASVQSTPPKFVQAAPLNMEAPTAVATAPCASPETPQKMMGTPVAYEEAPAVEKPKVMNVVRPIEMQAETVEGEEYLKPILNSGEVARPTYDPDPAQALQVDPTVKHYQPEKTQDENVEPIPTDMVIIPGGEFYRGSTDGNRDEMPYHVVALDSFAMDIHPVTNEQFVRFLQFMGGEKDYQNHDLIRLKESRIRRSRGRVTIESGYARHPVVGVTWYGAVAYANWLGKRLPTEAEWEVACRGGLEHCPFPGGEELEKNQANYFSSDTTAVKSYAPNGYDLYDMVGNVYEWCQDWYGYNYYEISSQEPDQPQGPLQGVYRVLRGGCWKSLKEDLRCSHRHRNNPGTCNGTCGFRCCADVG